MALPTVDYFQLPLAHTAFSWGSRFGLVDHWHPNGHRGTDLMAPAGTVVKSIAAGRVRRTGWSACLGWYVVIEHQLRKGGTVFSGYNHLRLRPVVKVGTNVARGAVIGQVGTTGSCTTGNHLHLTLGRSVDSNSWDTVVDPRAFIEDHDTPPDPTPARTPLGRKYVVVKTGQTLGKVAATAGISLGGLLKLNPSVSDPDHVKVGARIRVK